MVKISTLRRISQVTFFILIVYIGVVGIQNLGLAFETAQTDAAEQGVIGEPVPDKIEILDQYGPVKTCRYVSGDARVFKGCSLHYFSKTLTTFASLNFAFILPHVLFFFILAFLLARFFCGWMCPLGFTGELMGIARKRVGYKHVKIPENTKSIMAKLRYAMLSIIIIVSLAIAIPALGLIAYQKELYILGCQICPARVVLPFLGSLQPLIYSFDTPIIASASIIGVMFLILFLSGFILRRPWCRICPSGALLSLFNSGSMMSKEKDVQKCTKCGVCLRVCPMDNKNIYLEKEHKNVSTANCVRCFSCIEKCPEKDCLKLKLFGKTIYSAGSRMKSKN